jgi:RNA polymerase sigma-70 factor (ECF subfamily)
VTYCLIPRDLAHLHDVLRASFSDDPDARVVVEARTLQRRQGDRRAEPGGPPSGQQERRRVRRAAGRRIAQRRVPAEEAPPPLLPRRARHHADRLVFVQRHEPAVQLAEDLDANRLVLRIQGGDKEALRDLYMRYFDSVYGYARASLRDRHEAEDVAQDVFMQALDALPRFEVSPERPFRAWLLQITRNRVRDILRRRKRIDLEPPESIEGHLEQARDPRMLDVLTWLSDTEVGIFVERLPSAQRQAIVLRYLLDFSTKEIATVLERSETAVRILEHRGLRTLEQRLVAVGHQSPTTLRRDPMWVRVRGATVLRARRFALVRDASRPVRPPVLRTAYGRPRQRAPQAW